MEAYFDALGGVPSWAVADARLKVIRREVATLNPTYAPTPPEFGEIARRILSPIRGDLARLEAIATAADDHEPTPEERARVAEGFAELRGELKGEPDPQTAFNANWADLERRARDNGHDPKAAMDAIQDQPKTGTWNRLKP